jgi:2-O-methyltransferase
MLENSQRGIPSLHLPSEDVRMEPRERPAITIAECKELIGEKSDPLILEIGANDGRTTEEFLHSMPYSEIFCFEPDPRAIAKFKSKISNPNVVLIESAVGAQNGIITFHQSSGEGERKDWDQSGSIRKPKRHYEAWPWVKFKTQIEVPIVRLDDWAADKNLGIVDLIWADIQGAESDLIFGGVNVIRNTRFFYTEYGFIELYEGQVSLDDICDALFKLGLVLCRRWAMDALFVNKNLNDLKQFRFAISRNQRCPCGSGLRYKHCHGSFT